VGLLVLAHHVTKHPIRCKQDLLICHPLAKPRILLDVGSDSCSGLTLIRVCTSKETVTLIMALIILGI
jgi:hypothetical protein